MKKNNLMALILLSVFNFSPSAEAYVNESLEKQIKQAIADVEYNRPEKKRGRANAKKILSYIGYGALGLFVVVMVHSSISREDFKEDDTGAEELNRIRDLEDRRKKLTSLKFKIRANEINKKTYHLCNYYIELAGFYIDGVTIDADYKQSEYFFDVAIYFANELYKSSKEKKINEFLELKNKALGSDAAYTKESYRFIPSNKIIGMDEIIEREENELIEQYKRRINESPNSRDQIVTILSDIYGRSQSSIKSKLVSKKIYNRA